MKIATRRALRRVIRRVAHVVSFICALPVLPLLCLAGWARGLAKQP